MIECKITIRKPGGAVEEIYVNWQELQLRARELKLTHPDWDIEIYAKLPPRSKRGEGELQ